MAEFSSDATGVVSELSGQMSTLENVTARFGQTLSKSLVQGIAQGKSFEGILQGMGDKLIRMSLNAAFQPLESVVNGLFGALSGTAGNLVSGALGGVASGGLTGVFGGAAMAAPGGAKPAAPMTINMAISTPDAESFRRSEAQVSAALARAVVRGQRSL